MKLPDDSLNIDVYKHFSKYYKKRGVGIISDNQLSFYSQVDPNDYQTHDSALPALDNMMYPDKNYEGWYRECDDVVIASLGSTVIIDLPKRGVFTSKQYDMLKYFFNELAAVENDFQMAKFEISVTRTADSIYENFDNAKDAFNFIIGLYQKSKENEVSYINTYNEQIVGIPYDKVMEYYFQKPEERKYERLKKISESIEQIDNILLEILNFRLLDKSDKRKCIDKFNDIQDKLFIIYKLKYIEEINYLEDKVLTMLDESNIFEAKLKQDLESDIKNRKFALGLLEETNSKER